MLKYRKYFSLKTTDISNPPEDVEIRHEDTDMMDHGGLGNPPVQQESDQVLAGVHGGHVEHDLRVGGVGRGVQQADISPGDGRQAKPAKEEDLS